MKGPTLALAAAAAAAATAAAADLAAAAEAAAAAPLLGSILGASRHAPVPTPSASAWCISRRRGSAKNSSAGMTALGPAASSE
jgi:hypothetical protein